MVRPALEIGQMYIGICNLRVQSVHFRWQKIVAFTTLNIAMFGGLVSAVSLMEWSVIPLIIGLGFLGVWFTSLWHGLILRSQEWIDYYTEKLRAMERAGYRIPVPVFSDPHYLSRETPEQARASLRFSRGVFTIIDIWFYAWMITAAVSSLLVVIHFGIKPAI